MSKKTDPLSSPSTELLRNAASPYAIPLTAGPYVFSNDMLQQVTESRIKRKRDWYYPALSFISFENGTLTLLNSDGNHSFELTITIEPHQLHVACSCGREVETLCLHAYKALDRLTWHGCNSFFKDYQPGGLVDTALRHKCYFTIDPCDKGLEIKARPEMGTVYQLSNAIIATEFNDAIHLPGAAQLPSPPIKGMALTWLLTHTFHNRLSPFLVPCVGLLNKGGKNVKGFQHFTSGTEKQYDAYLTSGQRALNKLSYDMWQLAERIPGSITSSNVAEQEKMTALLSLWHEALPLLQQQVFLYSYRLYGKKELKYKPCRQWLSRVELSAVTPQLRFRLWDRGDLFQLCMQVALKGNVINDYSIDNPFFIRTNNTMYLLQSIKDVAITEWMHNNNNCITIFKHHFETFRHEFLDLIRAHCLIEEVSAPLQIKRKVKEKNFLSGEAGKCISAATNQGL
ncbi:hypothetical protein QTN47_16960 [Danxiaibacter flavus]|uniref:SWIM-type domain-containing protein n=1 Tax=Danxiaibacter flavus TaxID=3049108 RepID=A0ABV3ZH26_9BACT|nr:hypothetical protein QNM32_16970 [Chitinophagaceae bacterium DXS]